MIAVRPSPSPSFSSSSSSPSTSLSYSAAPQPLQPASRARTAQDPASEQVASLDRILLAARPCPPKVQRLQLTRRSQCSDFVALFAAAPPKPSATGETLSMGWSLLGRAKAKQACGWPAGWTSTTVERMSAAVGVPQSGFVFVVFLHFADNALASGSRAATKLTTGSRRQRQKVSWRRPT